jgi:hypothetical protein
MADTIGNSIQPFAPPAPCRSPANTASAAGCEAARGKRCIAVLRLPFAFERGRGETVWPCLLDFFFLIGNFAFGSLPNQPRHRRDVE